MTCEYVDPFVESMKDFFATMLNCEIERDCRNPLHLDLSSGQVFVVKIEFHGTAEGELIFLFPSSTAEQAAKRFIGIDIELDNSSIQDSIAEIANIVAGGAKSRIHSEKGRPIDLSLPCIISQQDAQESGLSHPNGFEIPFSSEIGNFALRAHLVMNSPEKGETMKALVVDDSDTMRRILKTTLLQVGFTEFGEAGDGMEAIAEASKTQYDLILMDWNMPNMSGLDSLKKIREQGKTMPIIMVTTESEKSRVIEALKAGANNYIIKPFKPDSVIVKVQETMARK